MGSEPAILRLLQWQDQGRANAPPIRAIVEILEKPESPPSKFAVTGIYFYDEQVWDILPTLTPSGRGELEITDVLNHYIPEGGLFTRVYDGHWTDAGTVPSLLRAAELAARDQAQGRLSPPVERPSQ